MRELYPELALNKSYQLTTSSGSVYFEESGNPQGIPVIFLHGGPGSGCGDNHRRYFNPKKYRIILMDQRGCNRSLPAGGTNNNTTQDILKDMESIREQLNIKKWLVFGGSWGSTLSLLYAEQYPDKLLGLILRGSFLAREKDLYWFMGEGVGRIFPDYWQEFIASVPKDLTEKEIVHWLHREVQSGDKKRQLKASITWATWAGRIVTSSIFDNYILDTEDSEKLINETRIEMHYATSKYFIEENQILENINSIPNIPIIIIHGRKDLTCLPEASWSLHQAIPSSELVIVSNAGHLASETDMIDALITATDNMATKLENIS